MNDCSDDISPERVAEVALGTFIAIAAVGLAKLIMNACIHPIKNFRVTLDFTHRWMYIQR